MGILMQQQRISRDAAFDVLRAASQHSNRKLAEVASEVADTGILAVQQRAAAAAKRRARSDTARRKAAFTTSAVPEKVSSRRRRVRPPHAVDRRRPDERTGYSWRPRRPLRRPPRTERAP